MIKIKIKFLQLIILIGILFQIPAGCKKDEDDKPKKGELTIVPVGNYMLSDIAIRKIDKEDATQIYFKEGNFAGSNTAIFGPTTYELDPAKYYIFFRYANLTTGSTGWWNNTLNQFTLSAGEKWRIEYGYYEGRLKKSN